jgi:hypothetical protein
MNERGGNKIWWIEGLYQDLLRARVKKEVAREIANRWWNPYCEDCPHTNRPQKDNEHLHD